MKNMLRYLDRQKLIAVMSVLFWQSIVAQTTSGSVNSIHVVKDPQMSMSTVGFDLSTHREASTAVAPLLDFKGMSKVLAGGNILWDETHGVYINYEPSGDFSSLSSLLSGLGFTVTTTAAGVNNVNLASYNVVVVSLGSSWYSAYTPAEVSALNTFVQNGGGLLILSDNTACPNANIIPLAQQFGITLGVSYLNDLDLYLTDLQSGHPLFSGVDTVYMRAAGELTVTSPATLVARDEYGKGAIAVVQAGSGRVLATGDFNFLGNECITYADNETFAANAFHWLNTGGTSTTSHITVTPTSLSVSLQQGDSTTRTMTIGNTGTASLTWSIGSGTALSSSFASVEAIISQRHKDNILPSAQPIASRNSVGQQALQAGGPINFSTSTIAKVNIPLTSVWTNKALMQFPRAQQGAVTHPNGKVYVFGGYNSTGELSSLEVYDPQTNSWTSGAPMPEINRGLASAIDNDGKIYSIGGTASQSYQYTPSTDSWSQIAAMPYHAWEAAAVKGYDGRIYVFGGEGGANYVQIYSPSTNTWSMGSAMPTARCQLSVVEGPGGYIYAIGGGVANGGVVLNTVEVYDPRTDTWSTAAAMKTARRQFGACLSPNGKIYTIGGKTDYRNNTAPFFSVVEIYDPGTNSWATGDSLPIALGEMKAVVSQGMMYVIGGANGSFVNYNFAMNVSQMGFWAVSPSSGTVPAGSSQDVTVKVNAKTLTAGNYSGNISITNNDTLNNPKTVPINLTVTTGSSPAITVTPSSFNVSLQSGDSTTRTLTIGNTGAANLTFSITNQNASSSSTANGVAGKASVGKTNNVIKDVFMGRAKPEMLGKFAGGAPPNTKPDNTGSVAGWKSEYIAPTKATALAGQKILSYGLSGSEVTRFTGLGAAVDVLADPSLLPSMINSYDVFYVAYSTVTDLSAYASAISSYISAGGGLVVQQPNIVGAVAIMPPGFGVYVSDNFYLSNPSDLVFTPAAANHPITLGLTPADLSGNFDIIHRSDLGTNFIVLATQATDTTDVALAAGIYGNGRIVMHTGNLSSSSMDPGSDIYVVQMLQWVSTSTGRWLSENPTSGTVSPGSTVNVTVSVNASKLTAGNYGANLVISNNDPIHNPQNVPVNLTVSGPVITSVVPNTANQGQTLNVTITGQNTSFRVVQGSSTVDANHVWFSQGSSTINANSVGVSSATSLTANFTIPSNASTGGWNVNVEQPAAKGTVVLNGGFTVNSSSPPTIISVVPNSAVRGQTLPVTITGQNTSFRIIQGSTTYDANQVWFSQGSSTINALSVGVSSATNLTATFNIPSAAPIGLWNVNVQQPLSSGIVTLGNGFTITAGSGVLMSLSNADIDFIGVRVGQTSEITISIRDSSTSSGNLTGSVSLSGTGFTLISGGGAYNLSPGQTSFVTIRYSASSPGFARGLLTINNNSVNYPSTATLQVRGYGVQLSQNPRRVLIDTLHGFAWSGMQAALNSLTELLIAAGHTVATGQPLSNLSSFDHLISAIQANAFTSLEVSQIQSFVNNGGRLLILGDHSGAFGYNQQNQLLSAAGWNTGIRVDSSFVRDSTQMIYGNDYWIKLSNFPIPSDPLVSGVDTLGVFAATKLTVTSPAQTIASTSAGGSTSVTSSIGWSQVFPSHPERQSAVNQSSATQAGKWISNGGEQTSQGFAASSTGMLPIIARVNVGYGQIVVVGDVDILADYSFGVGMQTPVGLRYGANRIFALNIFQGGSSSIPTPKLILIRDVPNDNGKQVFVRWRVDQPAVNSGIARFGVWRKDSVWTFLQDSVPAVNDTVFQVVAPTIYDSTKVSGMRYTVFRVTAHAVDPHIFTISPSDSGYSVDNLPPSVPKGVRGSVQGGGGTVFVYLTWNKVPDKDLRYYAVYRSETQNFTHVDSSTFVGASADTTYRDSTVVPGKKYYYRIAAFDWSGNRSDPSDQITLTITLVDRIGMEIPEEFSLSQNYPNPFNPATTIRFGVPVQSRVKIEVFNSIGQRVATLMDGERGAGYYEVSWKAAVASGIYIYRIEAVATDKSNATFVQVKKMMLVR